MSSASDTATVLADLLAALDKSKLPDEPEPREPVGEFVYSFLLDDALQTRADHAYKRVTDAVLGWNELRVSTPDDVALLLGKTYPNVAERSERLTRAMDHVFRAEHELSLAPAMELSKRDGRKYLESLDGMTPFVAARVSLLVLGAHAAPVDERIRSALAAAGAIEPDLDCERASAKLERAIKSADGVRAHAQLVAWADDPGSGPAVGRPKSRPTGSAGPSKKRATRKKTTKRPSKR